MNTKAKYISTSHSTFSQKLSDYKLLVKFKLNLTVVFSSVMAYLIAAPTAVNWPTVFLLGLGGFLLTGAANALNQVFEKDYDRLMKRTENRPLAAGRMTMSEAVMAAGFMSIFAKIPSFPRPSTAARMKFGILDLTDWRQTISQTRR